MQNNVINNLMVAGVLGAKCNCKEITAIFKNGNDAVFHDYMFDELKADDDVKQIFDNETGEVLYAKGLVG